jgi:hypothetical protein
VCYRDAVEAKLDEFNGKVGEAGKLTEMERADLDVVIQKLQNKGGWHSQVFSEGEMRVVRKLMGWGGEWIGPVLNLLRVMVLHPSVAQVWSKEVVEEKVGDDVVTVASRQVVRGEKVVTSMLGVRVLCNCFGRRVLAKAMGARFEGVLDGVLEAVKRFDDDNLRASCFALYINFTLLFIEDNQFYEAGKVQLLSRSTHTHPSTIHTILPSPIRRSHSPLSVLFSLPELLTLPNLNSKLVYRLLVILGTLLYEDPTTTELAVALEVGATVEQVRAAHSGDQAVQEVVKEVKQALAVTS